VSACPTPSIHIAAARHRLPGGSSLMAEVSEALPSGSGPAKEFPLDGVQAQRLPIQRQD
jgi:hypothetical protein